VPSQDIHVSVLVAQPSVHPTAAGYAREKRIKFREGGTNHKKRHVSYVAWFQTGRSQT
jgi:hypothetical protein